MMRKTAFCLLVAALLLCCGTLGATPPGADEDTVKVYNLEEVSVTGSRTQMTLGTSARIVTVLDSLSIANLPAQTVNDLLKYAVGVDVRQRGVMGMQTDISVRGGTFDQIAILLNGINISDPQTGHNAADFPVGTDEIDHIEILEGPAARVYGTSSLVGAINIITRRPESDGMKVHFGGGSYMSMDAGASISFRRGAFSSLLTLDGLRTDGYTRNSKDGLNGDANALKAFWNGRWEGRVADLSLQAGFSNKNFGSNTFYSAKFDDQFEHTAKSFVALSAETRGAFRFKPSLYWNYAFDRFELFRGNEAACPFNYHKTNVLGANLGAALTSRFGESSFGVELRSEGIVSTNLGEPLEKPSGHYVRGRSRTSYNIYLEHSLILQRFTVSGGLSAIGNTLSKSPFGLYPGLDASFRISDSWKLYTSVNTSLRNPTFTDLYYSAGGHSADKNLNPERMTSLEGGLKYMKSGFRAVASLYYHHGTDMIDWIRDLNEGEDALWRSVNHTTVNTLGEEFTLTFDFPVMTGNPEFFLSALNLGYGHISQDKAPEPNLQSAYALEYLRNKVTAQADFRLSQAFSLNLSCRRIDRAGGYEPYTLLGARLNWVSGPFRLYAEGDNLLNVSYYDHFNVPQPGIWLRAGMSIDISLGKDWWL
ncbi:MAG: TonB-dependent receptor [Bacteroidales bacterium]|nr:TonB-dependent receptor [Bacteroidales bacterium]